MVKKSRESVFNVYGSANNKFSQSNCVRICDIADFNNGEYSMENAMLRLLIEVEMNGE